MIAIIRDDLHLSATEVGLLSSIPPAMFAIAALAGSLLVARLGITVALVGGLLLVAGGSALRALIIGRKNLSAIGTLVERTSNYTMLLYLPDGYTPELVRDALAAKIKTLPEVLRASLTGDQGPRCGTGKKSPSPPTSTSSSATPMRPGSGPPTRTPTACSANTFRKAPTFPSTALQDLDWVAAELNDRPRKRLRFRKPVEQIADLLLAG